MSRSTHAFCRAFALIALLGWGASAHATAQESLAKTAAEMKPYTQEIPGVNVKFDLVPIPAGEFVMGSPDSEEERGDDEGPQHPVAVAPFWMGTHEVTWDGGATFGAPAPVPGGAAATVLRFDDVSLAGTFGVAVRALDVKGAGEWSDVVAVTR